MVIFVIAVHFHLSYNNPRKTLAISFFDQMLDLLLMSLLNFSPLSLTESSISYFLLALAGFNNVPVNINSMRKTMAANTTAAEIIMNADNVFSMPIDLNFPVHMHDDAVSIKQVKKTSSSVILQYLPVCQQSGLASGCHFLKILSI